MRRSVVPALALFSLLGGCKKDFEGIQIDPRVLIPADATLAGGFEVDPIRNSALGPMLSPLLSADSDFSSLAHAIEACELDAGTMRGLIAGTMADDRIALFIEAKGIGDENMVRCLDKEAAGTMGLVMFKDRGKVRYTEQEGGGHLIMLNRNLIAVTDTAWDEAVFKAIEDEGARSTDTIVAKAAAEISPETDLWATLAPSASDLADLQDWPGIEDVQGISVLVDLASGMEATLRFDFGDPGKAEAFSHVMRPILAELSPAVTEAGFPGVLDGVDPTVHDGRVDLTVKVSSEALPGLLAAMGPMLAE